MAALAVDTSVAVPLLLEYHADHAVTMRWWRGRTGALAGHALTETYSVLTRLPPPLRLTPADAATLMTARFDEPLVLGSSTVRRLPQLLAASEVQGGAVYDAIVALTALEHGCALVTRDGRAQNTYQRMGAEVVVAPT